MTNNISGFENTGVLTPLSDAQACLEGVAVFYARAHYVVGHEVRRDILLGTDRPEAIAGVITHVDNKFNERMPGNERYHAAALTIIRFCLSEHPSDDNPDFRGPRMEIGPTVIVGDPQSHRAPLNPASLQRRHSGADGSRFGDDIYRQTHPIIPVRAIEDPAYTELIAVPQASSYAYVATKPGDFIFGGEPVTF